MAEIENSIATATLENVNIVARTDRLNKIFEELDNQIAEHNKIVTKSEQEIVKRNAIIERKQNQVDIMTKKLHQMINNAGVSIRIRCLTATFFVGNLYILIKNVTGICHLC